LCVGEDLRDKLQKRFDMINDTQMSVLFIAAPNLENAAQLKRIVEASLTSKTMLIVLAVVCPDPMSIAWEDYSRQYAQWLNMASPDAVHSSSNLDKFAEGQPNAWNIEMPKYLLNCYDIEWAIHELNAALTAMCCEISFAEPGWLHELTHEQ
jgi:hypothetical protein